MHKDCIILCHSADADGNLHCLQNICNKKFIEYVTEYLSRYHICKIIFSISTQAAIFKKFILDNRSTFSFAYDFAEEKEYNGTGSAIQHALQYSDTPDVLIVHGHSFFDVNIDDLIAWQQTKMGDVTLALSYQKNCTNNLIAHLDENNLVNQFDEVTDDEKTGLQLGGIYCLFRPSFLNINFPHRFSFEKDYLMKHRHERDFIGMISNGYFLDSSKNGAVQMAQNDFPSMFSTSFSRDNF